MHYELTERLKNGPKNARHLSTLNWVNEKKEDYKKEATRDIRSEIQQGVGEILKSQPTASPQEIDRRIATFSEKLEEHLGRILAEAERSVKELTGSTSECSSN